MKVSIVFSMKANPHKLNAFPKVNLFDCFSMLYSIKNVDDLENLEELVSLERQVKAVRLQDKLGKQNFQDMKKVFEPATKSLENTSQDITKTITETSIKNNQALKNLQQTSIKNE